ncbi:hypothetical protein PILCRDRAFT_810144 [Piloderma croceum F 1598]|uniref:AB hydrolase-1 domain-containing protein n=1 Tax=Piloderma croceum (strain F 1598) TaxID=765440 RepID=A0A0C3CR70_PILCF|nr:hypothetical protein PILCRDRAFT_810144 [Piloderma croceum F 1598]
MPTSPVDPNVELYFTDSGPVADSTNYTTLVIFHGTAFNGNIFSKLVPFAAQDNIRLVLVNRRHYSGSTKLTDSEFQELKAGQKSFMERMSRQVANFLLWFAESYKIPQISSDRKTGGFALMGWSFGNAFTISVLGHPEAMPKDSYQKLEPCFRQLIMYESAYVNIGRSELSEQYKPFTDPDLKGPEAIFNGFGSWISGYFNNDVASGSFEDFDFAKRGEHPSFDNMTPAEKAASVEIMAAATSEPFMWRHMRPIYRAQTRKAFFDEHAAKEVLPHLELVYIYCTRTHWSCAWGLVELKREIKEEAEQGRIGRSIRFTDIPGANHLVHWDDPKAFWAATVDIINN